MLPVLHDLVRRLLLGSGNLPPCPQSREERLAKLDRDMQTCHRRLETLETRMDHTQARLDEWLGVKGHD